jgi:hypothetical protein
VKSSGTKSFVNIRFVITILLGLIVLGCENQSNTPLSGRVQGMSMAQKQTRHNEKEPIKKKKQR